MTYGGDLIVWAVKLMCEQVREWTAAAENTFLQIWDSVFALCEMS